MHFNECPQSWTACSSDDYDECVSTSAQSCEESSCLGFAVTEVLEDNLIFFTGDDRTCITDNLYSDTNWNFYFRKSEYGNLLRTQKEISKNIFD